MSTPDATASPQDQLVRMIVANNIPEELAAGLPTSKEDER